VFWNDTNSFGGGSGLAYYIFSWTGNSSDCGTWYNITTGEFSGNPLTGWSNVSNSTTCSPSVSWRVYVNDTAGNWNATDIQTYQTNTAPKWSNNKTSRPSGSAYDYSHIYQFNVTWTDSDSGDQVDTVLIEHNFTGTLSNYSMSNLSSEYYYDWGTLGVGTYVWRSYANDSNGEWNSTDQWTFVVEKAKPVIALNNNTAAVNTSGLVGYWRFEGVNSTNHTLDSSGFGNAGQLIDGNASNSDGYTLPSLAGGKFGNALEFDEVDDYVEVPDDGSLDVQGEISFGAWVYDPWDENVENTVIDRGNQLSDSFFSFNPFSLSNSSSVLNTGTLLCSLNAFSSDQIPQESFKATAKYITSLACGEIGLASDRKGAYSSSGTFLTLAPIDYKKDSISSFDKPDFDITSSMFLSSSSIITSGENSSSFSEKNMSSLFVCLPLPLPIMTPISSLASITNFIYYTKPFSSSLLKADSFIFLPSSSASFSVNLDLEARNSSTPLCRLLDLLNSSSKVLALMNSANSLDQSTRGNSFISFSNSLGILTFNSAISRTSNNSIGANNLNSLGCPSEDPIILSKGAIGSAYSLTVDNGRAYAWINNTAISTAIEKKWEFIYATYNGSTLKLYKNGVLVNSTSLTGGIPVNSNPLTIGGNATSGYTVNGSIDEVQIWNRSLSAEEIKELYRSRVVYPTQTNFSFSEANGGDDDVGYHFFRQTDHSALTNLSLWLPFSEGSGNSTLDYSVYGNGGTLKDGNVSNSDGDTPPQWTDGKFGKALSFDGADDYVEVLDDDSLDGMPALSVEVWIKPADLQVDWAKVLAKAFNDGTKGSYYLQVTDSDKLEFCVANTTSGPLNNCVASDNNITVDVWTHIVGVYNGQNLTMYVNGTLQSAASALTGSVNNSVYNLTIGRQSDIDDAFFNGSIDEVRIYSRALSADEIRAHYEANRTVYTETLGAGEYFYEVIATGGENYTKRELLLPLNVTKGSPVLNIGEASGWSVIYPTVSNVTANDSNIGDGDVVYRLYRNGTEAGNYTGSGSANDTLTLGAGSYTYVFNTTGGANWTSGSVSQVLAVSQNQSTQLFMNLTLDGDEANKTVSYGTAVNASGNYSAGVFGDQTITFTLYRNGTVIGTGNPVSDYTVLGAGVYIYVYNTSGNENYSAASKIYNLTVVQSATYITLTLNGTEGNRAYDKGAIAFINASLNVSNRTVYLYANFSGQLELINSSVNETTNITDTGDLAVGSYLVKANWTGDENYSSYSVNVTLTVQNSNPVLTAVNYSTEGDGGWGEAWTYYVNLTEVNNQTVNVSLWYNRTGVWGLINSTDVSCVSGGCQNYTVSFTIDPGWDRNASDVGTQWFKLNATDYEGGTDETGVQTVTVYKDDVAFTVLEGGGNPIVVRNESDTKLFRVRINDTDRGVDLGAGFNCSIWFTKDGASYSAVFSNTTDASGNCTIYITPDCSYSNVQQYWKAGTVSNSIYKDTNQTAQQYRVYGQIIHSVFDIDSVEAGYAEDYRYQGQQIVFKGNASTYCTPTLDYSGLTVNFWGIENSTGTSYSCSPVYDMSSFGYAGQYNCTFNTTEKSLGWWDVRMNSSDDALSFYRGGSTVNIREFYLENQTTEGQLIGGESLTYNEINQTDGFSFVTNFTLNNTGTGRMYSANISNSTPMPAGWSINTTEYNCGTVGIGGNCSTGFEITIPAGADPGTYILNFTGNWTQPNSSKPMGTSFNTTTVTLGSNPVLDIDEAELNITVQHDTTNSSNFTVNSTGNDYLYNITYSCVSGAVCTDNNFTVSFSPVNISTLQDGYTYSVEVSVAVSRGYDPGNYSGTIRANATDSTCSPAEKCWENLTVNVEVPINRSWFRQPVSMSRVVYNNQNGVVADIQINNTGNVAESFNITQSGNASSLVIIGDSNPSVSKQSSVNITINYSIPLGLSPGIYVSVVNIRNSSSPAYEPVEQNVTVTLDVRDNIAPNWSQQAQDTDMPARGDLVNVSVFWEDNINLSGAVLSVNKTGSWENISNMSLGGSGNWSNFSIDTSGLPAGRVVEWKVYANDSSGNWNVTAESSFTMDNVAPNVENVSITPAVADVNYEQVSIQADASDNVDSVGELDVWTNITWASGSVNQSMSWLSGNTFEANYTPTTAGVYNITVYANDTTSNVNSSAVYSFTAVGTTAVNVSVNVSSNKMTVSGITQYTTNSTAINVTLENLGSGAGRWVNVSWEFPSSNWSASPNIMYYGNLSEGEEKSNVSTVTVPVCTLPADYLVNATANWTNPDNTGGTNKSIINMTVSAKRILNLTESSLKGNATQGIYTNVANLTVNSTGNDMLENITLTCKAGSGGSTTGLGTLCQSLYFSLNYTPNHFNLSGCVYQVVIIDVKPETNAELGESYWGTISVNATDSSCDASADCYKEIELNVTVTNEPPVLENESVDPASGGWGEVFNFSVDGSDINNDWFNVTLYINRSSGWEKNESKTVLGSGSFLWQLRPFNQSDTGERHYKFEYVDLDGSDGSPRRNWTNTSAYNFTVEKDDAELIYRSGNASSVNRAGDANVTFSVQLNDTDRNQMVEGETVSFWVYYNNTWNNIGSNSSDADGNVSIKWNPGDGVEAGEHSWKANYTGSWYKDNESEIFILTVNGNLTTELAPDGGTYMAGTDSVVFRWNMSEDNGSMVTGVSNKIEIKLNTSGTWTDITGNCSVSDEGSGWYNCTWPIPADQGYGWYDVRLNVSKSYYNNKSSVFGEKFEINTTAPALEAVNYSYSGDGGWGELWNYTVNLTDPNPDVVNISLWYNRTGVWELVNSTNVSCPCSDVVVGLPVGPGWNESDIGTQWFKLNATDHQGGADETGVQTVAVDEDDVAVVYIAGNETAVNRAGSESVELKVRINDTDRGSWAGSGVNVSLWVTTDGSSFREDQSNTTDAWGFANISFNPDCNYGVGKQQWKTGVVDDRYKDSNSSQYNVTIRGSLSITIVAPAEGTKYYKNDTIILNSSVGYDCSDSGADVYWYLNGSEISSSGNSSWSIPVNQQLGSYVLNASTNLTNYNSAENQTGIEIWGRANVTLLTALPPVLYRMENLTLNASVRDHFNGSVISGYNCMWLVNGSNLANSTTGADGNCTYMWEANGSFYLGFYWLNVSIGNESGKYIDANVEIDGGSLELWDNLSVSIDSPSVNQTIHRAETVWLNSTVSDEVGTPAMDNYSISWYNSSDVVATGNQTVEDVEWAVAANHTLGKMNLTVNASGSYYNSDLAKVEVWFYGWANLTNLNVPADALVGQIIDVSVKVVDANSTDPVPDYPVNFHKNGSLQTTNLTGSDGVAHWIWNTTEEAAGWYTIKMNISDNSTLYYNVSFGENQSDMLLENKLNVNTVTFDYQTIYRNDSFSPHQANISVYVSQALLGPADQALVEFFDWNWSNFANCSTDSSGNCSVLYNISDTLQPGNYSIYINASNESLYNPSDTRETWVVAQGILTATLNLPADGSIFHKTDTVTFNTTTVDENGNVVNSTVNYYNESWVLLNSSLTNETAVWTIPADYPLGVKTLYANTSRQWYDNSTDNVSIEVWGWSRIDDITITPNASIYNQSQFVVISCLVSDYNSTAVIENHPVRFWYNSTEIGVNVTNSSGIAVYRWQPVTKGSFILNCSVGDNSTLYYNNSAVNESSTEIQVQDITKPVINEFNITMPSTQGIVDLNKETAVVRANVTDNVGVYQVYLLINGSYKLMTNVGGDIYEYNCTFGGSGNCGTSAGSYWANISAKDTSNNVNVSWTEEFRVIAATTGKLIPNPASTQLYGVTYSSNESFILTLTFNTTGEGSAYYTNISVEVPSNFTVNATEVSCGKVEEVNASGSCVKHFNITVLNATPAGTYYVNQTVEWENPDGSKSNVTNQTSVKVTDKTWSRSPAQMTEIVYTNTTGEFNITINNTGEIGLNFTISHSGNTSSLITIPGMIYVGSGTARNLTINYTIPINETPSIFAEEIEISNATAYPPERNVTLILDVRDNILPVIENMSLSRSTLEANYEKLNISADVTDNINVSAVWVNITWPTGSVNQSLNWIVNDTYRVEYTPTQDGVHTVTVYANDSSGNLNYTSAGSFTVFGIASVTNEQLPRTVTASGITQSNNYTFVFNVTVTNVGNATMRFTNITVTLPSGFYSNSTFETCGNLTTGQNCSYAFEVNVTAEASEGQPKVWANATWENPDLTTGNLGNWTTVTVVANTVLEIVEVERNLTIGHGSSDSSNFTISSDGNKLLRGIAVSDDAYSNWTVEYTNVPSTLAKGSSQVVYVSISVPAHYSPGNYTINTTANATVSSDYGDCSPDSNCWDVLKLNVEVPVDGGWNTSPAEFNQTVEQSNNYGYWNITINNTGNLNFNFTVTFPSGNLTDIITSPSFPTSIYIGKGNLKNFTIEYLPISPGYYYGQVTFTNSSGTPSSRTVYFYITVQDVPPVIESVGVSPTTLDVNYEQVSISAQVSDNLQIDDVWAEITTPSGSENVSLALAAGDYSNGTFNGTYTPGVAGSHSLQVCANDTQSSLMNCSSQVNFTAVGSTSLDVVPNSTSVTLNNVTLNAGEGFSLNINLNNVGNGGAYWVNASFTLPENWTASPAVLHYYNISDGDSKYNTTTITAPAAALPGVYTVTLTANWTDPDNTAGQNSADITVTVESNPVLDIVQSAVNATISHNSSGTVSFTLNSTGNDNVTDVDFACQGPHCSGLSFAYSSSGFGLPRGNSTNITLNITVPLGHAPGNYSLEINASGNGTSDTFNVSLEVPEDRSWTRSPAGFSTINVGTGAAGDVGTISVSNLGNVNLTFAVSISGNLSGNLTVNASQLAVSKTGTSYIRLNYTAPAVEGLYTANVTISNSTASPAELNTTITMSVSQFRVDIISPNATVPAGNVSYGDLINITLNATFNYTVLSENITFSVLLDTTSCPVSSYSYSNSSGTWSVVCTAPNMTDAASYELKVTGNYSTIDAISSDTEQAAVVYKDVTSPVFGTVTAESVVIGNNVTVDAVVSDNVGAEAVVMNLTYPNGSSYLYSMSNLTGNLSSTTWRYVLAGLNRTGSYDIFIEANDSVGNVNNYTTWFELYNITLLFSGQVKDAGGNAVSAEFEFYRSDKEHTTLYRIYNFTSNSSTGNYSQTLYNKTYDLSVKVFGHTIQLYSVPVMSNVTNPLLFDDVPTRFVSISDARSVQKVIGVTNLLNISSASVKMNFSGTSYDKISSMRVFKCSSWDWSGRSCNSSWSLLTSTVNVSAETVTATGLSSFSAYAAAEAVICGDSICDATYGESCSTCSADCGSCPTSTVTSGGGGGGGGGGGATTTVTEKTVCGDGVCGTGENSQNCPADCKAPLPPFSVETDLIEITLHPGESRMYTITISNNLDETVIANLSVIGRIWEFLQLEKEVVGVKPMSSSMIKVKVFTLPTTPLGVYTGDIIISVKGEQKTIPVTLLVVSEKEALLDVKVETITKQIEPNGTVRFHVSMYNLGFKKKFDVHLTYRIKEVETEKLIKQKEEEIAIETSLSFVRAMAVENLNLGKYYLEVEAEYDGRKASSADVFEVAKPFWTTEKANIIVLAVLILVAVVLSIKGMRYYKVWRAGRRRYVFPVSFKDLPKGKIWFGKIAESDRKAFFNMDDLTTHIISAGATGSGKSVSAMVIVEELLREKLPVVVFDPTAQWTGFVKRCTDKNMLAKYREFGMKEVDSRPYKGMIYEVTDPDVRIDFKKYMNPGEITVFTLNKLKPGQYDKAVRKIIRTIFEQGWEESPKLRLLIVFDEVHRLLEKYGGKGGYIALEKACREFRKWGIGLVMISQVLADFKEALRGNVLTEIQMHTKSLEDIDRVSKKYGKEYSSRVTKESVGIGMVQNPKYNKGKPYFVEFRPLLHNPHKIKNEELAVYKRFAAELEIIEEGIEKLKKKKIDTTDIELEFRLANDKLKTGAFRMAEIYIESLKSSLERMKKKK
jgi:uncharacterized membrane protein